MDDKIKQANLKIEVKEVMNILLVCTKSPWPPKEGGPIAMNAMVEGLLNAGHKVKVLAINSYKYNIDLNSIPYEYRQKTGIEVVFVDLRVKPLPALLNLFSSKSYHVQRFISNNFEQVLTRILKERHYDIIQFESLFVTPYIEVVRKYSKAPLILRAHNIEHLIWNRLFKNEKNWIKKLYLRHLSNTLKKYELGTLKKLDGVVAITQKDADFFKKYFPEEKILAIPFGIEPALIQKYGAVQDEYVRNTIFHLGSMNWMPNQEGIQWFIKEVWPSLLRDHNELTLRIAGREMPNWLSNIQTERIMIDGEVPDAIDYMKRYKIMVVPLFSGSGIRIKIIEGMMAGCAIITTRIGAEGINCKDGEHLLFAESKKEFIAAILKLLNQPLLVEKIGHNAASFIKESHNNKVLISQLETFYADQRSKSNFLSL